MTSDLDNLLQQVSSYQPRNSRIAEAAPPTWTPRTTRAEAIRTRPPRLPRLPRLRRAQRTTRSPRLRMPTAEPFRLDGGPSGVLLVHGFMGYPDELRPLAEAIAARGFTVSGMLLARHGGEPDRIVGARWSEWAASVARAYAELEQRCERVAVVGYSLGGLLALHLASTRPVAAIVTLAAALRLQGGWPLRTLPVARYVMPWFYPMRNADWSDPKLRKQMSERMGEINWDDPQTVALLQRGLRIPTGAIYELVRLGRRVRRELPRVTAPALVLQGRLDRTVQPISAEQVMSGLGSSDKQLVYFERSGHGLPNDVQGTDVRAMVAQWLEERLN